MGLLVLVNSERTLTLEFGAFGALWSSYPKLAFRRDDVLRARRDTNEHNGLLEHQIGLIAGLRPWVNFPTGIILSGLADVWRRHRSMMVVMLCAGTAVRALVLYANQWGVILAIVLVGDAVMSPVTILTDSVVMAACPGEGEYGRQRLWGAVGWGIFSFVAGEAIERVGFFAVFVLNALFMACTAAGPSVSLPWQALDSKLVETSRDKQSLAGDSDDVQKQSAGNNYFQRLLRLLSSTEAIIFFVQVTVMGYAVGTIEGFLFLYLEDLGGTETLMGLTLTVTCVSETLIFYCMGPIQQRIGLDACFHICFLAFALRLVGYIFLSWLQLSPWAVLPLELLHGITFGMTWSVGTTKSALIAPPGLESTSQSAFQGLMFGLGHGIGGSVSGLLYRSFLGQIAPFGMAFCVICLGWAGTSVAQCVSNAWSRRSSSNSSTHLSTRYTRVPMDVQLHDIS